MSAVLTERTRPTGRAVAILLALSNLGIGLYVIVCVLNPFYRRLTFPGVLEHQESMTVYLVHRMSESIGHLYQMPSLLSESVIYNPLFYFYLWALHPLIGESTVAIRLASVLPPLVASAAAIEFAGRKFLSVRLLGWSWAFLSLALYPSVTWIDLARPEALLFLSILLVWLSLCASDAWKPKFVLVGLAVAFSFSIKQPGALFALAPLALAFVDRRYLVSVAVAGASILLFVAAMTALYGEPYLFWTIAQPASHPFALGDAAARFWHIFVLAPAIVIGPLVWVVRRPGLNSPIGKYLVVALLTLAISALGAGKVGGWYYQYVVLLFIATIPAAEVIRGALDLATRVNLRRYAVVYAMCIISILMIEVRGKREAMKPNGRDRLQHEALQELVRTVDGETWVTTWPHIDLGADHPVHATINFLGKSASATKEAKQAIRSRRFSLIVTSDENQNQFDAVVRKHYFCCGTLHLRHFGMRLFAPTTFWAATPEIRRQVMRSMPDRMGFQLERTYQPIARSSAFMRRSPAKAGTTNNGANVLASSGK